MPAATSPSPVIDIDGTGLDRGGHLLIKRALQNLAVGSRLGVTGTAPDLAVHLLGWCRAQGHGFTASADGGPAWITKGSAQAGRWHGAESAGQADSANEEAVADSPRATWGLAARGATVDDPNIVLLGRETIYRDGERVGWLSSAGWGHTVRKNIGFGYARNASGLDEAFLKTGIYELEVAAERHPCTLHLAPLYDPRGGAHQIVKTPRITTAPHEGLNRESS